MPVIASSRSAMHPSLGLSSPAAPAPQSALDGRFKPFSSRNVHYLRRLTASSGGREISSGGRDSDAARVPFESGRDCSRRFPSDRWTTNAASHTCEGQPAPNRERGEPARHRSPRAHRNTPRQQSSILEERSSHRLLHCAPICWACTVYPPRPSATPEGPAGRAHHTGERGRLMPGAPACASASKWRGVCAPRRNRCRGAPPSPTPL